MTNSVYMECLDFSQIMCSIIIEWHILNINDHIQNKSFEIRSPKKTAAQGPYREMTVVPTEQPLVIEPLFSFCSSFK